VHDIYNTYEENVDAFAESFDNKGGCSRKINLEPLNNQ
jgi:hypothetical protein